MSNSSRFKIQVKHRSNMSTLDELAKEARRIRDEGYVPAASTKKRLENSERVSMQPLPALDVETE